MTYDVWPELVSIYHVTPCPTQRSPRCSKMEILPLVTEAARTAMESSCQSERLSHHHSRPYWMVQAANHRRSDQSGFKLAQPQTSKLPLLPQTPRVIHPITSRTMFLQRTASALARRSPARAFTLAQRPFSSSIVRCT